MMGIKEGENGWLSLMTFFQVFQMAQSTKAEWEKFYKEEAWRKSLSGEFLWTKVKKPLKKVKMLPIQTDKITFHNIKS